MSPFLLLLLYSGVDIVKVDDTKLVSSNKPQSAARRWTSPTTCWKSPRKWAAQYRGSPGSRRPNRTCRSPFGHMRTARRWNLPTHSLTRLGPSRRRLVSIKGRQKTKWKWKALYLENTSNKKTSVELLTWSAYFAPEAEKYPFASFLNPSWLLLK